MINGFNFGNNQKNTLIVAAICAVLGSTIIGSLLVGFKGQSSFSNVLNGASLKEIDDSNLAAKSATAPNNGYVLDNSPDKGISSQVIYNNYSSVTEPGSISVSGDSSSSKNHDSSEEIERLQKQIDALKNSNSSSTDSSAINDKLQQLELQLSEVKKYGIKGDPGASVKGDRGETGKTGETGKSVYMHIKYADEDPSTNPATSIKDYPDETTKYMGVYSDTNPVASSVASAYRWTQYKDLSITAVKEDGVTTLIIK